ncbi:MAG TPA: hypothetical protein VMU39_23690 [Solirubrobacteraceae bacterium]|nr:hypothetical protein [Solirubrobacteraceae bacterium]
MTAGLVVVVAVGLTLGGEGTQAAPRLPHFTIWMYNVKVGTKGALTYDGRYHPPSNPANASDGDVRNEHFVGSFSVDTRFDGIMFAAGKAPGVRNTLGARRRSPSRSAGRCTTSTGVSICATHSARSPSRGTAP